MQVVKKCYTTYLPMLLNKEMQAKIIMDTLFTYPISKVSF